MAAPPPLLRTLPLLRHRLHHRLHHRVHPRIIAAGAVEHLRRPFYSSSDSDSTLPDSNVLTNGAAELLRERAPPKIFDKIDDPDYRKWKDVEQEILRVIDPIILSTKEILHSDRYMDGERLLPDDEKFVLSNLLAHHPHAEDKIGCGLDSIMVDRHPQFRHSRCLFVVRSDGGWIDFSYQKCLREYIQNNYPLQAERFIREHFKRGRG